MYQRKGTLKLTNERLLELGKITGCMDFQIKLLRDKIEDMTVEVEEGKKRPFHYEYKLALRLGFLSEIFYTEGLKLPMELVEDYLTLETKMPENLLLNYGGTDIRLRPQVEEKIINSLENYAISKLDSLGEDVEFQMDDRTTEQRKADKEAGKPEPTYGRVRIGKFADMKAVAKNDRVELELLISGDEIQIECPIALKRAEEQAAKIRLLRANLTGNKNQDKMVIQ